MNRRATIADLERRLTEVETRHGLFVESWAQAEWETDAEGIVVTDSPSWRAYTGQSLEEWLGYGWVEAIHPDDRAYAERQWREAIAVRGLLDAEFRLRASDGGWRWTNVRAAPVLDATGQIEKWVGINIDIDARKRAEAALRESEERVLAASEAARIRVTATLESIGDAFYAVDADFRLTYVNAKAETMWGRSRETLIGRNLWSEFPVAVGGEPHAQHLAAMRDRRLAQFEGFSPVLDRWMEASLYPDPTSGGLACYFRDITERRAAEAALRASEEKYRRLF